MDYCITEMSIENIYCYDAIQKYKKQRDGVDRRIVAIDISYNYLRSDTTTEVNINKKDRDSINELIYNDKVELSPKLFDSIEMTLVMNMSDTVSRFTHSAMYTQCKKNQKEYEMLLYN